MGFDARGDVSVVELAVYVPVLILSVLLSIRHRKLGWAYLVLLSIVRIVGAATHIGYELTPGNSDSVQRLALHIVSSVMESSGLAPLLLAALGLLGTVKEYGFEGERRLHILTRIVHVTVYVALVLSIVGGIKVGVAHNDVAVNNGVAWRRVGAIMFLVDFLFIISVTGLLWQNRQRILLHRRTLLLAVTASLVFLAVRLAYAVCAAYAPTGFLGDFFVDYFSGKLAPFTSVTGSFVIYLAMSVLMELAAVAIYLAAGWLLPLQRDYASSAPPPSAWTSNSEDNIKLENNAQTNVHATGGQGSTPYVLTSVSVL